MTKSLIVRALIIYLVSSFFRKPQTSAPAADLSVGPDGKTGVSPAQLGPKITAWNYFENGVHFDMFVYMSDSYDFKDFHKSDALIWRRDDFIYNDWSSGPTRDGIYTHSTRIKPSHALLNNGSAYLHTYVVKSGQSPDPSAGDEFAGKNVGYARRQLNRFKKVKRTKTHNLLTGEKADKDIIPIPNVDEIILSHWHPNITINLITDQTNWVQGAVPPPLNEFVTFLDGGHTYLPVVYYNDYWNLLRDYQPINKTDTDLELTLTFQPLGMFKWQLYAAQQMKNKLMGNLVGQMFVQEEQDEDQDSLKETLLETNPYLLGITVAVSILHSVFELLAFKNDIQFWKERKSLEGLSVRSVFFGVFQSLIVLLYVLDNETNFMIRMSCFMGLGIEVWKIQKVCNVSVELTDRILGIFPRIRFSDKGSYVESSTRVYDNLAFKYLGWLCFPLLVGFGVYSLMYNEHKGWYSFTLNMLYGFLLTFGFIMMTPQLFINYKLKSVAHLPWRMMTYKFLNTFIDDIFAFVIKMPTMYRLGCFRDDIVFFIFLYQRWIYKVDKKRVNEFGFSGEMEQDAKLKVALPEGEGGSGGEVDQQNNKTAEEKKTE